MPIEVPRGLSDVVVAQTEVGDVRGTEGFYHYRQYSGVDLARSRSFTDVWFLFLNGRLPDAAESADFAAEIAGFGGIDPAVAEILPAIAKAGNDFHPLAGLRTVLSALAGSWDLQPMWDTDADRHRADALRICAVTPTVLAALYRLRAGLPVLPPRPELGHAGNWIYQVTGSVPDQHHTAAIESYLVAAADHGFNASTFTARVIASSGADLASAICGAIGTFSGPLHGGAPDRALEALDEIGSPDRAEDWVRQRVLAGDRIMGFGHAVYRTEDPRAAMLRDIALDLGGPLADFAVDVERTVVRVLGELKPDRKLQANVEFYAGVVMEQCGIPREMFTPTFTVSRVVGWCANILEQAQDRKIIRPIARYVGPAAPQPVPPAEPGSDRARRTA